MTVLQSHSAKSVRSAAGPEYKASSRSSAETFHSSNQFVKVSPGLKHRGGYGKWRLTMIITGSHQPSFDKARVLVYGIIHL